MLRVDTINHSFDLNIFFTWLQGYLILILRAVFSASLDAHSRTSVPIPIYLPILNAPRFSPLTSLFYWHIALVISSSLMALNDTQR